MKARDRLVLWGLRALVLVLDAFGAALPVLFFFALFWLASKLGLWQAPWDPEAWKDLP